MTEIKTQPTALTSLKGKQQNYVLFIAFFFCYGKHSFKLSSDLHSKASVSFKFQKKQVLFVPPNRCRICNQKKSLREKLQVFVQGDS